jgi:hypothetical protein
VKRGSWLCVAAAWLVAACGGGSDGGDDSGQAGSAATTPGCKRGIAYPGQQLQAAALSQGLSWWYNWGLQAQGSPAGVTFEPMVWGDGFDVAEAAQSIPEGAQYLLGFNEPNFFEQADLSAQEAAALWPQVEQIAAQRGLALVSPAVNFCGDDASKTGPCHDTSPFDYLEHFFDACSGCRVDFVAVHWYNCDGDSLQWYLGEFKRFGRPIWLTEFACAYGGDSSVTGQEQYMREAIPLLEDDADVFRYAWFSADAIAEARLIEGDGALTELGQLYVGLPHNSNCTQ